MFLNMFKNMLSLRGSPTPSHAEASSAVWRSHNAYWRRMASSGVEVRGGAQLIRVNTSKADQLRTSTPGCVVDTQNGVVL